MSNHVPDTERTLPMSMRSGHPLCQLEHSNKHFRGSASHGAHKDVWERIERYDNTIGEAIDDLYDIQQILAQQGMYAEADRLRTIMGRLARVRRNDVPLRQAKDGINFVPDLSLIRHMCLKW